ncbi:dihydrolipoamide acetyltransferase family protein [Natrarchaeobaculum sulfurireducens]|uniref:Dihydrolipoamide acetyltransferase component (E2) of acetoin dehydrogenase complex n=1 Tax=Natrarchaeobaculum sulfurireducens TaxID=2044521 RepID=A0A346PV72_9EURY|nr:dihydrolipoamide acetyltransferase family protein [Natrarchaeobaculum sulfurireducens]AXR79675.1 Pyruvate/2-oxoglutarate dehydrogenase complex, dihydrolipoamide acyltransferase (E2) component [Natrarchaeobaculum sulfurireducens]AXR83417.1 Dihydrolipoamide acetyltransferase component (E2) of acetoin dehydrogenase complex [Natrarchaeobaculum sulfurireducens]
MVHEFTLPDVGEGVAEGELVSWLVEEGDEVTEDQPVAEVETDKALVEVPSPVNATVQELHWEEGDVVPVGDLFVTYAVDGDDESEGAAELEGEPDEAVDADAADDGAVGNSGAETTEIETPQDRVFAPPRIRRLAREEDVDLAALEGSGPGGRLTAADVRAAATGEQPVEPAQAEAPASAQPIDGTAEASEDVSSASDSEPSNTAPADLESADLESADRERTLAAPATRRLAEEMGVDIDAVPAVEERDGEAFVTAEAVEQYAEAQRHAQQADREAVASSESTATKGTDFAPGERERREPFRGVRKTIADAMVESKYTAPHVTHHDEVDVTALAETRERLKSRADEQGIRLTYMPFITKAVVAALKEFPEMNAVIDDENEEIVYRDYYNVGVATATDVGLMVPVLEDADQKGLLQLSSEMNELVQKARERTISPDELRGSTFTITNVGGIGGEYATPILNYPEAGILAIGEMTRKPRVVTDEDGEESIEPRSVLPLSLSFDHRLIDGAVGAQFTNTVMEYLEHPELLLLE